MRAWRPRRSRRGRAARLCALLAALGATSGGHLPRPTWATFRSPGGPSQQLTLTVDAQSACRRRLRGGQGSPRLTRTVARHARRGRRRDAASSGTDTVEDAAEANSGTATVVASVSAAATATAVAATTSKNGSSSSSETSAEDEVTELEVEEGEEEEEEEEDAGDMEEVEEFAGEDSIVSRQEEEASVQEEGSLIGEQTCAEIQREMTLALTEAQSSELDVVQFLRDRDLLKDSLRVAMALRVLRLGGRNEEAIALFAASDEFCEPDIAIEAELLAVYGSMGRWTPILDEFNRLKQRRLEPDRACYNCVMVALAYTDQQPRALEILQEMKQRKIFPDVASYEWALKCSNDEGSPDVKLGLLRSMKANGLVPSQDCYRRVLRSLAKSSAFERSLELLDEMREKKVQIDEMSLNYVLTACITGMGVEQAFGAVLKLEADASITFSELHYDMCISACESVGRWQEIILLAARMGERGISPDCITCNSVLRACVELGNWQDALTLLDTMQDDGIELDGLAYSTVLKACAQADQWEEVLRLHAMIEDNQPSVVREEIAQPVIAALWELGRAEDARRFYHEATDRGWLRLWRRRRFGAGPAMLDTRRVVPQVANIAVGIALSEARQGDMNDPAALLIQGASARKEAQDVVVVVNDEDIGGKGEVLEAVEGSTAAAVLEVARQVLGTKAKLECLRDPVACIRIPGSELEVQRVQEAIKDFMLGPKQGL